jgi:biotin carboxyl carrier protein
MKYLTKANGQTFEITVERDGRITVGDQSFHVDMRTIEEQALLSLLIDHHSYELVVDEHRDGLRVLLWGDMYEVAVEESQPRRMRRKEATPWVSPDEECAVCAPMPGLVVQVPVSINQQVAEGDVLVILESMKMENELLAPRGGIVKEIHVSPGDTANLDDLLIVLC